MRRSLLSVLALAFLLPAFLSPLAAQPAPKPAPTPAPESEPITIGTSHRMRTHDADRRINVVVPPGYDADDKLYPLVLVLDGGLGQDFFLTLGLERWNRLWQRSSPVIFAGIETVDRQRELLPPTRTAGERTAYPSAGQGAAFRRWIAEEVLPMLRARYRTDGRAFLIGESAAGHFVAETWVTNPALFDGYAALSPSLQWDDQALSRQFRAMPARQRPPLFISLANEGGATEEGLMRLLAGAGPETCFADRRGRLVHANTLHGLFPEALQYLLPTEADWLAENGLVLDCTPGRSLQPAP